MIRALRSAATGMFAQELYVDVISNNLSNVNTTGFKKSKIEFQDLLYQNIQSVGAENDQTNATNSGIQIGHGTKPIAVVKQFGQGDIQATENPLDFAIDGDGFFQVQLADGTVGFTRDGTFKLSADGQFVTSDGLMVEPSLALPQDTQSFHVGADGTVSATLAGENEPQSIGQFELAKFINPAGLKSIGRNLFAQTVASGEPQFGTPEDEGFGRILQGVLEISNVNVVEEMINLIVAQRAYEINSKAIKTADEMLTTVNALQR